MNVLLSYLPRKISNKPDAELFGNQLYANYLPRILKDCGYEVDYIDWQDTSFKPSKPYALFIGHGGYNFTKYAPHASKSIYFSTGFYWKEFNRLEDERFEALYQRRGVRLQPDRRIETDEESALKMADGIITLGNEVTRASHEDFKNVYAIGGMTAQVGQDLGKKEYEAGRKHFLFYSGDGAVHKGLDLLIEAFSGTDLQLHICYRGDMIFENVYHQELELPNFHYYGKVDIHGDKFKELINLCDWIISATCCEGCPSSILECMVHGLIPVVTKNASVNMSLFGFYILDNIEHIKDFVAEVPKYDNKTLQVLSIEAQGKSQTYYSSAAFSLRFKEALEAICQQ